MKIALFLIMCSGVAGECMPPHHFNTYTNFYDCFEAGYTESLRKTNKGETKCLKDYTQI